MNEHDLNKEKFEQSVTYKLLQHIDNMKNMTSHERMALKNATNTICDYLGEMSNSEFQNRDPKETAERLHKLSLILAMPLVPYLYVLSQPELDEFLTENLAECFQRSMKAGLKTMRKGDKSDV